MVARVVLVLSVLAGTWWASSAFVPSVFSGSRSTVGHAASLGGDEPETLVQGKGAGIGAVAPLGIALLGLAAGWRRQQRSPGVTRHFFGSPSTPAPRKIESYKDYEDPWLGAADFGFDPFNIATGSEFDKGNAVVAETTYYNYRESEVKHGRFAMAAFLAIFFEEADRGALPSQLGMAGATDNLDATLGLDEVQAPVLALGLGFQALAEYNKQQKEDDGSFLSVQYEKERCPGDLGFDPLSLGGSTMAQKIAAHNLEVNLGRLGMIGVTSFIFREFLVKDPELASKIL